MKKKCICGEIFEDLTKNHNKTYCSQKCKSRDYRLKNWKKIREIEKKYAKSKKGKERSKRFSKTDRAKVIRKRFYNSEKGKALVKRFQNSDKWKRYIKEYNASEKAKEQKIKYAKSGRGREVARINSGKYKEKYPERIKKSQAKYRKSEKYLIKERKFRKSPKGKELSWRKGAVRRGRKKNVEEKVPPFFRKIVLEAFGNKCFKCGITNEEHKKKVKNKGLALDHIDSLFKGNPLNFDNVCVLCYKHNGRKFTKGWNFYTKKEIKRIRKCQQKAKEIYNEYYK